MSENRICQQHCRRNLDLLPGSPNMWADLKSWCGYWQGQSPDFNHGEQQTSKPTWISSSPAPALWQRITGRSRLPGDLLCNCRSNCHPSYWLQETFLETLTFFWISSRKWKGLWEVCSFLAFPVLFLPFFFFFQVQSHRKYGSAHCVVQLLQRWY